MGVKGWGAAKDVRIKEIKPSLFEGWRVPQVHPGCKMRICRLQGSETEEARKATRGWGMGGREFGSEYTGEYSETYTSCQVQFW
jgi:hypothetical protein